MDYLNRERIFGKRTVHRINPQTGQDEYYYLDPRGARTFAEMKEIPVPSENSPNPFADEIQNYLYEHDDYNYKQLYGNTPPPAVQTQVSAQQPENNTANATLGQPSSYFQNNNNTPSNFNIDNNESNNNLKNNVSSQITSNNRDVNYYFSRDKDDLCFNEGGFVPYAYLDTATPPNTTIGCGINVDQTPNIQLYHALTGKPLSEEELEEEIKKLKSGEYGKLYTYYADKSNMRIAPEENDRIMKEKYVDGYNYVTDKYPDFPVYTENRQKALMDMAYGLGTPRFSKYTNMRDAILQNNWKQAANEAWRCGVGFDRNKQTVDRMYPGLDTDKMKMEHCKSGIKK